MYCSFQPLQIDVKLNHYLCHFLGSKWANKPPKQVGYCFGDFVATVSPKTKLELSLAITISAQSSHSSLDLG